MAPQIVLPPPDKSWRPLLLHPHRLALASLPQLLLPRVGSAPVRSHASRAVDVGHVRGIKVVVRASAGVSGNGNDEVVAASQSQAHPAPHPNPTLSADSAIVAPATPTTAATITAHPIPLRMHLDLRVSSGSRPQECKSAGSKNEPPAGSKYTSTADYEHKFHAF
ncbi:hypothetical protein BJ138DRAFT_1119084 [Hygrophoropsis aurantiaca]|uniref:Uncharacterized protein n=1 Tax=Hygrophoropsis aurantiaca TaxID=72124 RepID=A0ACB7ZVV4_9AGAM|nr:hypothetical protein BJ138DRAFT_1119084 [Hygrophoropsis aurantiaca]